MEFQSVKLDDNLTEEDTNFCGTKGECMRIRMIIFQNNTRQMNWINHKLVPSAKIQILWDMLPSLEDVS